ncbi:MAG: hypothetical protein U5L45_21515 [Saprospiraceae bacterium]|nr:hypothetical protein [Saprospiraceae bacterium]
MVRFSAKPKNEPFSPRASESEREMQKTLLGYAHPSVSNYLYFIKFPVKNFNLC